MRPRLLLTVLLCACAFSASAAPGCLQSLLEELGWRFEERPALAAAQIDGGRPCERADLADAQASGDLQVALPRGIDAVGRAALYRRVLAHPATTCAYAFRLGDATRRAVDRLVANPGYRFSALQLGWIGFGAAGPERNGWRQVSSFGRGFVPQAGNWRAIEGFYSGQVRAECGVGRQVAQYAAQAELYGPEGFDAAFAADEIVIGRWRVLNAGGGILQGAAAGEFTHDGLGRRAAALGRQAFPGVPGFITHSFARHALDDVNNQAQNFVVYDVSAAAAQALRARDGFAAYNAAARELWDLSRTFPEVKPRRFFERLLLEDDAALRDGLDAAAGRTLARMEALLDDPFFREFRIYVHRRGVRPVGDHFVRMLDRNPRTPFHIEFALHNVHTTLRDRWIAWQLSLCAEDR